MPHSRRTDQEPGKDHDFHVVMHRISLPPVHGRHSISAFTQAISLTSGGLFWSTAAVLFKTDCLSNRRWRPWR